MYRRRLRLLPKLKTEQQHKHQICHMPHTPRFWAEPHLNTLLIFASPKFVFHSGILFAYFFPDNA